MKRLLAWWRQRQRSIDVEFLWPALRDQAPSLEVARAGFMLHAMGDPAWQSLGELEISRQVGKLT